MRRREIRFSTQAPLVYAPHPQDLITKATREVEDLGELLNQSREHFGHPPFEVPETTEPLNDVTTVVEHTDEDGEWVARWTIAEHGDRFVVRGLTLEPRSRRTPNGGITANLLRALRPGAAIQSAAAIPNAAPEWPQVDDIASWSIREARAVRRAEGPEPPPERRQGRPPLSDDHLCKVALAYLRELRRGPGVLVRLAEEFDRTEQTMRDQVSAARHRGWLGPAPGPGRKGGGPGPRLLEVLKTSETEICDD